MKQLEEFLTIVERADRVMHNDVVECLADVGDHRRIFGIHCVKLQLGMQLTGNVNHGWTEVDTDPLRRFQRSKGIPYPAADIKNARALRDEKAQVGFIFSMKKCRSLSELSAGGRESFRMRQDCSFARRIEQFLHDYLKDRFILAWADFSQYH